MLKGMPTAVILVAAGVTTLVAFQAVDPSTLPESEGKDVLTRACGGCHDLGTVTVSRHTPADWKNIVDDMIARGVQADDADVKKLVTYLSVNVGRVNVNRASEEDLKTVVGLSADEAAALVKARSAGTTFHTLDDVKKIPGLDPKKVDEHKDQIAFSDR